MGGKKMQISRGSPYAAYQNTGIKTASQGKLVVMLYQGAVKALMSANDCFSIDEKTKKETIKAPLIETYGKQILKAQEIIGELQVSLDMEKGGDIAKNLLSLYVYFNQELQTASISRDRKKLTFVLDMMKQLSSAWETAANTTTTTNVAQPALNIQG